MKLDPETIDISIEELEKVVDGARHQTLSNDGHRKLRAAVETLGQLARMLADKDATVRQLRQMLLKPATTEKTRAVLERAGIPTGGGKAVPRSAGKQPRKGHGRKPARLWQRRRWAFHIPCCSRVTDVRSARRGKSIH